jgi:capsular polysaccharide biosynthesis protein cpsJ
LKKTDADIAIGNFIQFIEGQGSFLIHVGADNYFEQVYSSFDWFHHQYDGKYNISQCFTVPWAKLYKAELFKDIVYPTNQKVEDDYTTYKVYLQADKIAYMNKAIYIHRKRSTSVTRTVNLADVYPLKSIEERLTILNLIGAPQELLDKEIQAYKWRLSIHEE